LARLLAVFQLDSGRVADTASVPEAGATHADFDGARGRAEDGQPARLAGATVMDWQKEAKSSTESLHMTGL